MTDPNPQTELNALRAEINEHLYRYHTLDAPIISDVEYDQLFQRLKALEAAHPALITPDSPTQRVGAEPLSDFEKVTHPIPLTSLGNAFNDEDMYQWLKRIEKLLPAGVTVADLEFVVEPKIDGLAVALTYRDGLLTRGATRGNGQIGENVTANLRTVRTIPLRIPLRANVSAAPPAIEVRGEVYIPLANFAALNRRRAEAGEPIYANARNTAAGSLRQLDSSITAQRPLAFFAYQVGWVDGEAIETQWDALQRLKSLGFVVNPDIHKTNSLHDVLAYIHQWMNRRNDLPYEADGAVVKINSFALQQHLGVVGNAPRWAIAYKFPAQEATTVLNEIAVNIGRTGVATPYAKLDAVNIGGVTVREATLHNFEDITRKDLRQGDVVVVKRAGDVIPQVLRPVLERRPPASVPYQPPTHCPVCGETLFQPEDEVALFCVNADCQAQLIRRIEYFAGRTVMDIDGFGSKIAAKLVAEGLLHNIADIYSLTREPLLALEGFQAKKVDNLLNAIDVSKTRPADRVLAGLGIRFVGREVAKLLVSHFGSIPAVATADEETLTAVDGVGPRIAKSVLTWFSRPKHQQIVDRLQAAGLQFAAEKPAVSAENSLAGKTFVITGTLPVSRNEAKSVIETAGGKVTGSVTTKTDYLLVGENPGGSKYNKAQKLGTPQLTWDALSSLLQAPPAASTSQLSLL